MKESLRGRPLNPEKQDEQKQKLFNAAKELLEEKSFKTITIRELSARAGVNSAMISYYFNNKEGLFIALIENISMPHFQSMQTLLTANNPIKTFIESILQMLGTNPAIARFIHDEVLMTDNSFRETFIEKFPKQMAKSLPKLLEQQQELGLLRKDLNPKYAAYSLIGLIMMPFVAVPVRELAWEISLSDIKSPEWAEHIYQLFLSGCAKENRE